MWYKIITVAIVFQFVADYSIMDVLLNPCFIETEATHSLGKIVH